MKSALLAACAFGFLSGAAFADEVTVTTPAPGVEVEHSDVVHKKVVVHDHGDCATKTVKKSDDIGNSVTRTKSDC